MDLFRLRRRMLYRRLWKWRCLKSVAVDVDKSAVHAVISKLSDEQLRTLVKAIEHRFKSSPDYSAWGALCVPVQVSDLGTTCPRAFVALCCRLWRVGWSRHGDVDSAKLTPLPVCVCYSTPYVVCCNPYHWTVDITPSSPVSDDSNNTFLDKTHDRHIADEVFVFDEEAFMSSSSSDAGIVDNGRPWCLVSYREYRDMRQAGGGVGSFAVHSDDLHIFADLHGGVNGLCLSVLRTTAIADLQTFDSRLCDACGKRVTCGTVEKRGRDAPIEKIMAKIGRGIVISRRRPPKLFSSGGTPSSHADGDENCVWLYNCSEFPVFVDSLLLSSFSTGSGRGGNGVCKVFPGHAVCVYDKQFVDRIRRASVDAECLSAPARRESVLVSFVKGWGGLYKRQTVLSCPCWLEIIINVPRLDR